MSAVFPDPAPHDHATAARRRRTARRGRSLLFTALGVVTAAVVYTVLVAIAPLPAAAEAASASTTITPAAVQPAFPTWGSAAVGLVGQDDLLVRNGSMASAPIASMTKTITALVLLDKRPIPAGSDGPTITFTSADVDILQQVWAEDGSWAPVSAGEQLTEKQALTAMLLPSANNYAISLANWGFGSVSAFLTYANSWLASHHFTGTHITDPSGLDPGTVSTPVDLVGIGKLVVANSVLKQIVDTPTATLPGAGTVENGNKLLGQDGVVGIKTGWTDQAGHCLLFAASVTVHGHPLTIVGVVTGAPDYTNLWTDVPTLLTSVEKGFHEVKVGTASSDFGSYRSVWGDSARLKSEKAGGIFVFSNAKISVTVRTAPVTLANPGDAVGTITYAGAGQKFTSTLTVSKAVTDPGLGWRLTHPLLLLP
ncbi:D-alanyl-D-alanine carboxypeptidase family protein [Humibacter ginsenosidimutans]|uniref:D-alanyl-D-alanine carboxypeptidase n=1 Tax=Humibacter ginsenosidimutans TaxID=2599293 RepID=A0A5B8LZF6_9MICO|nr:D-alanyl-D-alanine carboxypeptidase [Humibacter ginsenosidimutans]QDZ13737.1 D-alanyl-D-alanine carboxypeptidase [Humibacter ginsenosidimutans]